LLLGKQIGGPDFLLQARLLEIGAVAPVVEVESEPEVFEVPVAVAVPAAVFLLLVVVVSVGTATSMVEAFPLIVVSKRAAVGTEVEVEVPVVVPAVVPNE
jgi:hypothetical protein